MVNEIEPTQEGLILEKEDNLACEIIMDETVPEEPQTQETGGRDFPLYSFPGKIRDIVIRMVKIENFPLEFCASAMLSAAAAAIGNAFQINIKGKWVVNPAQFMMLAGRPGIGKTPPMEAAYGPLRRLDQQRLQEYIEELEMYEETLKDPKNKEDNQQSQTSPKPILVQTILSDFTTESMLQTHEYNKLGVAIVVDEIMGMFNTGGKLGKGGNRIETLLSAFSGSPLKVSRKTSPLPFAINKPCISIIGTIQVARFREIFDKGLNKSGLIDRFIVVYPREQKIPLWDLNPVVWRKGEEEYDAFAEWENIMKRIFSMETKFDELGEVVPTVLNFSEAARNELFTWRNLKVIELSENMESAEVESREMKRAQIVSKIALTLQVLKWVCGEGTLDCVDLESVKGAIALSEYYEDCFCRILNTIERYWDKKTLLLSKLPEVFTTRDALDVGKQFGISERGMKKHLQKFIDSSKIRRIKHGLYSQNVDGFPFEAEE